MTRRIWAALIAAGVALALAVPVLAGHIETPHQTANCAFDKEAQFKLDIDESKWEPDDPGIVLTFTYSDEGEPVDVSAPDGWTIVCAKVPKPDKGAGISHVVVVRDVDPDPELDCEDEDYANRNPEECEQGPDPTVPSTTSTTTPTPNTLPCVVDCGPPDSIPEVVPDPEPVVTTPSVTTPPELPFTGLSDWLIPLAYAGLGMLVAGSLAAWFFRDRLS